jgi:cell fate regulator YaaT (PSP1 superfamily)
VSEKSVVGVRFRRAGKIYYFDPGEAQPKPGDTVIVETIRGIEAADVVVGSRLVPETSISQPLRPVLRRASAQDLEHLAENREKEKEALRTCGAKVAEHKLEMRLVGADYTFDRGKLIFYFTSEGRVDFRQLVRDLSASFKTRIELRQIGVRDQAKMLGGLGSCGRQLCCCTFLAEFQPVSIKMAKKQDLSLNPAKISGLCGRLMCCLRYEAEQYAEAKAALAAAKSPPGEGPPAPVESEASRPEPVPTGDPGVGESVSLSEADGDGGPGPVPKEDDPSD